MEDLQKRFSSTPPSSRKGRKARRCIGTVNPDGRLKKYSKVLIDPVIVYQEAAMDAETRENYQTLANNAYAIPYEGAWKGLTIVTAPGPGTVRIQFAIVSAEKSAKVRNFVTTIVPVGMVISTGQYGVTGKTHGGGGDHRRSRLTDAMTGELLAAALDKRVGGKQLRGIRSGMLAGCGFRPAVSGRNWSATDYAIKVRGARGLRET